MIRFEILKIFSKARNKVALLVLLAVLVAVSILTINQVEYVDENQNHITGITAARTLREEKNKWKGYLTEDVFREVYREKHRIYAEEGEEEAYYECQGLWGVADLINSANSPWRKYDYFAIDNITEEEAAAVYEKRIANLKEYLDFGGEYYTDKEKEYLIAQYQDLDTPLYYEYFDGWSALQQSLPTFLMILALVAGFFLSGMFSEEFQTKADAVFFSTKLGRNKAVRAKIGAGLLVSTVLYVVFTLLYTAIVLFVLGPDGANCPIQLDFWRSSYNITILEGYLMIVAGGYVGMLFTSGMAILVSVLTRSTVIAALVPVFIICFLPFLSRIIPLTTVFSFFPDKLFNIYDGLRNFSLTEIGRQVMNISSVILPLYFVVALLLIPLVYRLYRKAEIK